MRGHGLDIRKISVNMSGPTATDSGSGDVNDFLQRIKELGDRRDQEDEERNKKLEEEILQGRKERQARRAGRSIPNFSLQWDPGVIAHSVLRSLANLQYFQSVLDLFHQPNPLLRIPLLHLESRRHRPMPFLSRCRPRSIPNPALGATQELTTRWRG